MENENKNDNFNQDEFAENANTAENAADEAEVTAESADETAKTDEAAEENAADAEYTADSEDDFDFEAADGDGGETDGEYSDAEVAEFPYDDGFSLEELAKQEAKKKSMRTLGIVVGVVVALVIAIVAYCVCVMNGVGTKSVVNTPVSKEENAVRVNAKYESPVMSMFDNIVLGKGNDTIIKVNDKNVSRSVFEYIVNSSAVNYAYSLKQGGKVTDFKNFDWNAIEETTGLTNAEYVRCGAVESLVPVYALVAEGEKHGITLSEEESKKIDDWLAQLKTQYGDQFETVLKQSGYPNEETLLEIQKLQMQMSKVYEDVQKDISKYASADKLKPYMDDEKITAKHILIPFEENADDASKAETKKKAEEILAKINAGEDFDKLREENNNDPGQPDAGYTFGNDGSMVQEFTDAAFALEPGQVSEIVETRYGYHIIKRVDRVASVNEYMDMLTATAKVRIKKNLYDNLDITVNLEDYLGSED